MKLALIIAVLAAGAVIAVLAYAVGKAHGRYETRRRQLAELGLTHNSVDLLHRASAILRRLEATHDVSGVMAGDVLSPETQTLVDDWGTAYRKEIRRT